MKGVQCYELFGGIALKIHTFSLLILVLYSNVILYCILLCIFYKCNAYRSHHIAGSLSPLLDTCMYVVYAYRTHHIAGSL